MIRAKNIDTIAHTWTGQEIQPDDIYILEPSEVSKWAYNDQVLTDIGAAKLQIGDDSVFFTSVSDQVKLLFDQTPKDVTTALEKNDKDLKAGTLRGDTDPTTGIAVVEYISPGTIGGANEGRYIMAAEAFFKTAHPEDRVTKIEVVDVDGLVSAAGTVLKTYHDDELPAENQGWYLGVDQYGPDDTRNTSYIEVKPLGGYAFLPAGFALRITAVKDPVQKTSVFYCNLLQGKFSV